MAKENKYGCIVCEDVCLKHDMPLIFHNFCEESPDLKEYVKGLRKQDEEVLINKLMVRDKDIYQVIKDYYAK